MEEASNYAVRRVVVWKGAVFSRNGCHAGTSKDVFAFTSASGGVKEALPALASEL